VKADKIYLVGFMAAGKTTMARALAKRLDWRAVDVDETIESREHGGRHFRPARRSLFPRR
jgi:shikimate kinase